MSVTVCTSSYCLLVRGVYFPFAMYGPWTFEIPAASQVVNGRIPVCLNLGPKENVRSALNLVVITHEVRQKKWW